MDNFDFLKEKLKEIARKTVLFGLLPEESLKEFEKAIDSLIQCSGSEKCVQLFIDLFEEERRELAPVIDLIKAARLDMHTSK